MRPKTKTINNEINNKLPKTTPSQKQIIKHIYKFRFINTNQLQRLFNHTDPTMAQEWLKDLKINKYIDNDYKREDGSKNNIAAKHFLAPLGRKFLKGKPGFDIDFLERVYKEKGRTDIFKNHCIAIVDMYLFFLSQKKQDEELKFFTESNLTKYEYFPETELDAYIVIQKENKKSRFFLHIFDDSDPKWLPEPIIKEYVKYFNEYKWQENTNDCPFPVILFVLPTEKNKYHIFKYGQAVLQKAFATDIHLFVETKERIKTGDPNKLWMKVS